VKLKGGTDEKGGAGVEDVFEADRGGGKGSLKGIWGGFRLVSSQAKSTKREGKNREKPVQKKKIWPNQHPLQERKRKRKERK